jgi:uncharacterized protein YjbI with pentapeptide repeats
LQGADLSGAILYGTRFDWALLKDARIEDAVGIAEKWRLVWEIVTQGAVNRNLRQAKLRDADLSGGNLAGADLRRADLTRAILRNSDLRGANLEAVKWEGAVLTDAQLDQHALTESPK